MVGGGGKTRLGDRQSPPFKMSFKVWDNQIEYDYQLIICVHILTSFLKKSVRTTSDNFDEQVEKNQVSGPIPIDRARFSQRFGARISFWDALSVDFEAVLVLSNILTIFRKCS